jgi:hypothetical protein
MSLKHIVSHYWSKLGSGNLRTTPSEECLNLKEKKEQQIEENCTKPNENVHMLLFTKLYAVKLFLGLINYAACFEDVWGSGGVAAPVLTPALDRGEWSASRLCRFIPWESAGGKH